MKKSESKLYNVWQDIKNGNFVKILKYGNDMKIMLSNDNIYVYQTDKDVKQVYRDSISKVCGKRSKSDKPIVDITTSKYVIIMDSTNSSIEYNTCEIQGVDNWLGIYGEDSDEYVFKIADEVEKIRRS